MRTTLFIVFSIFIVLGCRTTEANLTSQKKEVNYIPYYLKVYEADSLYIIGDYQRSYEILDSLFEKFEPKNFQTILEYQTYIEDSYRIGKIKKVGKKTEKLITDFGYSKEMFVDDSTSIWNKIYALSNITDKKYQKLRNQYLENIDWEIRSKVDEMNTNDQYYRKFYNGDDIEQKRNYTDSINAIQLKKWFDKGIYPNEEIIGNGSVDDKINTRLSYIFLHIENTDRINYFIPKMYEFVKQGKCTPHNYASMIDQMKSYNKQELIYAEFNKRKINPEDYYKYNPARKEIGLPSLEYTAWKLNLILESKDK